MCHHIVQREQAPFRSTCLSLHRCVPTFDEINQINLFFSIENASKCLRLPRHLQHRLTSGLRRIQQQQVILPRRRYPIT